MKYLLLIKKPGKVQMMRLGRRSNLSKVIRSLRPGTQYWWIAVKASMWSKAKKSDFWQRDFRKRGFSG